MDRGFGMAAEPVQQYGGFIVQRGQTRIGVSQRRDTHGQRFPGMCQGLAVVTGRRQLAGHPEVRKDRLAGVINGFPCRP
ncbi:hypothetical protein DSCO28_26610 [Desulfosarcina ovata subsp. sediminis]|uniref:Uncharacterized protein n=1 Tax=Desulfosarcina ovata subsp. sediminis TaxID=885957 RepID=A0A5K7ZNI5_9BACT|nr:hypothetical protein DSCO28_26610 [Desulfosarcina ovata subsp. sediminis]